MEEGPGRMLELMLQVSAPAPAPLSQPGSGGASFSRPLRPGDDAAAANGGERSGLA